MSTKKLAIILGGILLIVFLLGGGFILVLKYFSSSNSSSIKYSEVEKIEKEIIAQETGWNKAVQDIYVQDKDFDSLADDQEKKIGTKVDSADTDKDGLNDGAEINIFKTDPLKLDTDGDGVPDGKEVARKTDPLKK